MNSNINEAPEPLPKQELQSENLNPGIEAETTTKCIPVPEHKLTGDTLIEYWSGGFRIPTE